jgi:agmatinase
VHFDAHPDTWPEVKGKEVELNHGTMFYRAVKEGLIVPERSVQTGIRTWVDDKMGLTIIGAPEVHEKGPAAALDKIKKIVGRHPAYLTFDIDCLDPAFAPGTGTPVAGGLWGRHDAPARHGSAARQTDVRGLGPQVGGSQEGAPH